jgi:hypothetical protein
MSATRNELLNKFGADRNTTLAGPGSAPSPFLEHPVMTILNHNREEFAREEALAEYEPEPFPEDFDLDEEIA